MRVFFEESRKLSLLYRRLETCGKPFAAAINGVCLGGAFELALACHYRVVSDDDATRVGLPEVKVGLFPGAGGTQRVARLMQTGDALQMLFKGEQIRPLRRKQHGPRHEVAPRDEIVATAKAWITRRRLGRRAVGRRRASSCRPARSIRRRACRSGRRPTPSIAARRTTIIRPPTRSCRPSTRACSCRWTSRSRSRSRYFAKILRSKEAAAMIRTLFVSMQELNKGARRPPDVPPTQAEEGRRPRRRLHGRRHRLCRRRTPASRWC